MRSVHKVVLISALPLLAAWLLCAAPPHSAVEAHRYADGVLAPRFTAALNDWTYRHPQDRQGRPWEH